MEPAPFPPQQKSGGSYSAGFALGFIPLILFFIGFGSLTTSSILTTIFVDFYLFLYVALFIAAIVCLCIQSTRFVGYGLLTAFLVIPVIAYIIFITTITRPHQYIW